MDLVVTAVASALAALGLTHPSAVLLSSLLQPPQAITAALSTFLPISETFFSLGSLPTQSEGRGVWSQITPIYSWGYKNRAIVKIFFGTLPIFYSRMRYRLFVLIMFFNTWKGLICMLWNFFHQSASVGLLRR